MPLVVVRRFAVPLLLLLLGSACSSEPELIVDLRTDLVPGIEFSRVHTEVRTPAGDLVRDVSIRTSVSDDGLVGFRVAEVALAAGSYVAEVRLLDTRGLVVAARPISVRVDATTAFTALITRDCSGVTCDSGSAELLACHGGGCVDARCTPESSETCEPECVAESDCPALDACSEARCVEGLCLHGARPGSCGDDMWCEPERGCMPLPQGGSDGGVMPDGGPPTDGGTLPGPDPVCIPELPTEISEDLNLAAGCTVQVRGTVNITNGATLGVLAGVTFEMEPDARIEAGLGGGNSARLIVLGTATDPVTFTSATSSPAAGDWQSVQLGEEVLSGTSISSAVFEHGGGAGEGALLVEAIVRSADYPGGRVTVRDCTFRNNAAGGVEAPLPSVPAAVPFFAAFDGNTFEGNGAFAAVLGADVVGSLGDMNTFDAPIQVVSGAIDDAATWAVAGVPYVLDGDLDVDGPGAVLTLQSGTEIAFPVAASLVVGRTAGSLLATGTTFRSAAPVPAAQDWTGIEFGFGTLTSRIEGCSISQAGRDTSSSSGVISLGSNCTIAMNNAARVTITGTTFSDNGFRDIYACGVCDAFTMAMPANTFDLPPGCE